jgi:hypothetical protein
MEINKVTSPFVFIIRDTPPERPMLNDQQKGDPCLRSLRCPKPQLKNA